VCIKIFDILKRFSILLNDSALGYIPQKAFSAQALHFRVVLFD
jgi:hypothetical protein